MITGPSDIPHTQSTAEWSLGAVLAQREIDERTLVVVIRADVGLGPSLTFERRLLGLGLAGFTTIVVDVGEADRVADVMRGEGRCTAQVSGFPRSVSAVSTVPERGLRA